jgi:hypothetical protein
MKKARINLPENWEYKDRLYILKGQKTPVIYKISSKHTAAKPLLFFDEELGYNRELRYATNQPSPFVDEQKGTATLGHIVFRNGSLNVPKEKVALQQLLSLYHPSKNSTYMEDDNEAIAVNQVDYIELEFEALSAAKSMSIEEMEGILRVEKGSIVSKMSSSEVKRDVLVMAKQNPGLFLELANDENVQLRNLGIKAVEQNIISLSGDNRSFKWKSNGRKLFTVPFDEHPYSALAAWFKTDEGLEVLATLEKRLK